MVDSDLVRLVDVAAADRQYAVANSQAVMADVGGFVETWGSLAAWSSSTFARVQAGRLYSDSQNGHSGANRSLALAAGETMRAVINVRTVSGGTSGGVIVGVSSDPAGAEFTAGGAASRGLYFRTQSGDIAAFTNGTATSLAALPAGTVDWTVTVTVDDTCLSVVAVSGSTEVRYRTSRGTVNNLVVFNSDTRELAGSSIGPLGVRRGLVTVTPRSGIEGVRRTVHWTTVAGTYGLRVALPPAYDARRPSPLALCFHGNGSDEVHFSDNANGRAVAAALSAAGYIVVSAAYTPGTSTWGSDRGLDAYVQAYRYVRDRYAIGATVLYGNSMGGLESLLTLRRRSIPAAAWVGTSPVCSLAAAYANPAFTATIDAAYGISASRPYATATAGHDPAVNAGGWEFRGLPMLFLAAADDVPVPRSQHTDVLVPVLAEASSVEVISTVGGHSFDVAPYADDIVAFFDAALGR
ncbi:hypothetical protein [Micromonospora chokoriensis]|uniref:hypothetical protein n=1 Tax=Micromonospora chokoriensis TaxID=356851 RepID=UPI0004C3C5E0|nr:hypothetical protein [Micromonospora chokoriensis]